MNKNYKELSEKTFGLGFAGFDMILREVSVRLDVCITNANDVKHYKHDVLLNVCVSRPSLSVIDAIKCIEYICETVMFSDEEIKSDSNYIEDNWEQIYDKLTTNTL